MPPFNSDKQRKAAMANLRKASVKRGDMQFGDA